MRRIILFFLIVGLIGCARVALETKKPLKVDINMRLDVYQHVVKDAESIEDQIYGDSNQQMNFILGISTVYAADSLSEAIERRKERAPKIESYFNKGYVGEDRNGYLKLIKSDAPYEVKEVISAENKDRKIIYQNTADKNNAKLSAVEKIFFKDHYKRAPSGWYFEIYDQGAGKHIWQKK